MIKRKVFMGQELPPSEGQERTRSCVRRLTREHACRRHHMGKATHAFACGDWHDPIEMLSLAKSVPLFKHNWP